MRVDIHVEKEVIMKRLLLSLICLLAAFVVRGEVYSGDCGAPGSDVHWTLDTSDSILYITGTGTWGADNGRWSSIVIKSVHVGAGITAIDSAAFRWHHKTNDIHIGQDVAYIAPNAFSHNMYLSAIYVDANNMHYSDYDGLLCNKAQNKLVKCPDYFCTRDGHDITGLWVHGGIRSYALPATIDTICSFACSEMNIFQDWADRYYIFEFRLGDNVKLIEPNAFFEPVYDPSKIIAFASSATMPPVVTESSFSVFHLDEITVTAQYYNYWRFKKTPVWMDMNITYGTQNYFTGTCGDNLNWRYGCYTKQLEIYGSGEMYNFEDEFSVPWGGFREYMQTVSFQCTTPTNIGDFAFYHMDSLTTLVLPTITRSIGKCAFSECPMLTSVTTGDSVAYVGDSAFAGCPLLQSSSAFKIGGRKFTHLGDYAFRDCASLTSGGTGDNVMEYVGVGAYMNTGIINLSFGKYDTVPAYFCSGCSALTKVVYSGSPSVIGRNAFAGCSQLPWPVNGNHGFFIGSVKVVGDSAFAGCANMEVLQGWYNNNNLEYIGDYAFAGCSKLTGLFYVKSVAQNIGAHAFDGTGFTSVWVDGSVPCSLGVEAFPATVTKVTVPLGSLNAYKTAPVWNMLPCTTGEYSANIGRVGATYAILSAQGEHADSCYVEGFDIVNSNIVGLQPETHYDFTAYVVTTAGDIEGPYMLSATTNALEFYAPSVEKDTFMLRVHWASNALADDSAGVEFKIQGEETSTPVPIMAISQWDAVADYIINRSIGDTWTCQYRQYYKSADRTYYGEWNSISSSAQSSVIPPQMDGYVMDVQYNSATLRCGIIPGSVPITDITADFYAHGGETLSCHVEPEYHGEDSITIVGTDLLPETEYYVPVSAYYPVYYEGAEYKMPVTVYLYFTTGPAPTGLEEILPDKSDWSDKADKAKKILHNGQIYIIRENKIYNLTGQRI